MTAYIVASLNIFERLLLSAIYAVKAGVLTTRGKPTTYIPTTLHANMNWQGHIEVATRNVETNLSPRHQTAGEGSRYPTRPPPRSQSKHFTIKAELHLPKKYRGGIGGDATPTSTATLDATETLNTNRDQPGGTGGGRWYRPSST